MSRPGLSASSSAFQPTPSRAEITPDMPPQASHRTTGVLIGLASALAFASSGSFVKPLLEAGWSLGAAALLRMAGAALVLSPLLIAQLRRNPRFYVRHWRLIVGFGLTGVAGTQLFYFAAIQRMPVAIALLVQYLAPVMLVALAWARTRRMPSRLVLWGSAISVIGLVLVVDIAGASFDVLGVVFSLAAALCLGAYFLLSEMTGDDVPPLVLAGGGLLVGAVLVAVLTLVGALPFVAPAVDVALAGVTVPWFVPLLWVILVSTALSYALGVLAVSRLGSRVASFVGLSEVLFAVLIAWLVLGEAPTIVQAVGGALIVVGVVLVRTDGTAEAKGEAASFPGVPAP